MIFTTIATHAGNICIDAEICQTNTSLHVCHAKSYVRLWITVYLWKGCGALTWSCTSKDTFQSCEQWILTALMKKRAVLNPLPHELISVKVLIGVLDLRYWPWIFEVAEEWSGKKNCHIFRNNIERHRFQRPHFLCSLWPGLDIVRDPFHEVGGVLVLHI